MKPRLHRREFFKMMAAATGAAAVSRPRIAHAAGETAPDEWESVVKNSSGVDRDADGPGTWNGVTLQSPPGGDFAGSGPYAATWDSLLQYEAPEWYRDAKFGIWAHWSPQCVPEDGDWYARRMYVQGEPHYDYHCRHYGHPSRFGYKDLCPQWTLLNWDPDVLIARYKKAGARIFLALANHHDGFDAWDSRHQQWNAVRLGPRRNVVGDWAAAARRQGLRFGTTVHVARNWWWFQTAHLADRTGPLAGVPYDGRLAAADGREQWWEGLDPQALYGRRHPVDERPDERYVRNFYDRVRDLIDHHDPDLLYFDDTLLPLGWAGMNIGAYYYNHNLRTRGGRMEAVLNIKQVPDRLAKAVVADYERGVTSQTMPHPWQSETCIGHWHYQRSLFDNHRYMKAGEVVHWLSDAVSKNGTFILNIPGRPDGTLDSDEIAVLDGLTEWFATNGEAIYETRPWKVFGEGPSAAPRPGAKPAKAAQMDARDVRFTQTKRGDAAYALVMGWPADGARIRSLGTAAETAPGRVARVEMLGSGERLDWKQTAGELRIAAPRAAPSDAAAVAFKVTLS